MCVCVFRVRSVSVEASGATALQHSDSFRSSTGSGVSMTTADHLSLMLLLLL